MDDHRSGDEVRLHWKSPEDLRNGSNRGVEPAFNDGDWLGGSTRRDFLTLAGFSLTAALAACRAPIEKAIPLLVGSDDITPGVASWYATTCGACPAGCGLLVKTRDGRPIKIEGNSSSALSGGGTCATGQAAVLSLYDDARLRSPMVHGKASSWSKADAVISNTLRGAFASRQNVVLLSRNIGSPSTNAVIEEWSQLNPHFRHVIYEPVSLSALREAQSECFGRAAVPHYRFDKARVIVSIDADFLGTWLSPVEFTRQYVRGRAAETRRSQHVQYESRFSVTGSNADLRVPIPPSSHGAVALGLLRRVAKAQGLDGCPEAPEPASALATLDAVAGLLLKHHGQSLIVSGSQDVAVQTVVATLNQFLGNIGTTVDLAQPSLQRRENDSAMAALLDDLDRGEIDVLLLHGVNPAYDHPDARRFLAGLKKVRFSVSTSDRMDETSRFADAVCPDHHFLESWGDAEPVQSSFSLAQPAIAPLFNTRSAVESLLSWSGRPLDHYAYLRDYWRRALFPLQKETADFDAFWDNTLREGVFVVSPTSDPVPIAFRGDWKRAAEAVAGLARASVASPHGNTYEVDLYESVALRDGRHANNPWLQELPDPISKMTWGNVAAVSPATAAALALADGDIVVLRSGGTATELPVLVQPGQDAQTISVAVGYGRIAAGKAGNDVGVNVFPLATMNNGSHRLWMPNVSIERTGRRAELATTQRHFSMEGRDIVQELSVADLSRSEPAPLAEHHLPSLWEPRPEGDHSWGMVIDLDSCTGCSACVIACQSENNVPVVGKQEVQRTREMHWIRIDRYYSGAPENPESVHQPMMCQHCGNAPCETVCPVLATTHSSDGLNQQIYNRCVGTRYCANNCPYKVRRFNWFQYAQNPSFDFHMDSALGRMVLNPDVTVRSRGVMEKCSLCVQRIQAGKVQALQEKRVVADGDIKTACQQACPAEAIVFGDLKDPHSRVSELRRDHRYYNVLDELGTRPNVGYLKKIRNRIETQELK